MTKKELRIKYKNLRDQIDIDSIHDISILIANNTLKLPIWDKEFYHVFLSIKEKKEVDTQPLLTILSGRDKHIVLSKSDFEKKTMKNYLLTDNTKIKINNYEGNIWWYSLYYYWNRFFVLEYKISIKRRLRICGF